MKHPLLLTSVLTSATLLIGAAPQPAPTTEPAGLFAELDPAATVLDAPESVLGVQSVRLTFAPGTLAPPQEEIADVIDRLRWQPDPSRDTVIRWQVARYVPLGDHATLWCQAFISGDSRGYAPDAPDTPDEPPAAKHARLAVVAALQRLSHATTRPATPADTAARFAELSQQLTQTRQMRQALKAMSDNQPDPRKTLAARFQALAAQRQQLDMQRLAKESRQFALEMAIRRQRDEADKERLTDPVVEQLQAVLKLREEEVAHVQAMYKNGMAPTVDVDAAKARLAEARAKLAERQVAAAQAGKGELLQKLADELTLLNVDLTDLQIQLDRISQQLESLNPARATTQSLKEILRDGTVPATGSQLPPLYDDLAKQEAQLVRQKLSLQLQDVAAQ